MVPHARPEAHSLQYLVSVAAEHEEWHRSFDAGDQARRCGAHCTRGYKKTGVYPNHVPAAYHITLKFLPACLVHVPNQHASLITSLKRVVSRRSRSAAQPSSVRWCVCIAHAFYFVIGSLSLTALVIIIATREESRGKLQAIEKPKLLSGSAGL